LAVVNKELHTKVVPLPIRHGGFASRKCSREEKRIEIKKRSRALDSSAGSLTHFFYFLAGLCESTAVQFLCKVDGGDDLALLC